MVIRPPGPALHRILFLSLLLIGAGLVVLKYLAGCTPTSSVNMTAATAGASETVTDTWKVTVPREEPTK